MAVSAAQWLVQAGEHVNQGRLGEAWGCYMQALQVEAGNAQAWLGLGMVALLQRQWPVLEQIADQRQRLAGDGFAYFHDVLTVMMSHGLDPLVAELGQHLAGQSPYLPSQLYYDACIRLRAGDEDGAFAVLARLKPLLATGRDVLPIGPDDRFNIAYRQATLVEDGDYPDTVDQADIEAVAAALPAVEPVERWPGAGGAASYTVLAACDGRYLERFGPDYLRSLDQWGGDYAIHVHVVAPTPDGVAAVGELARHGRHALTLTSEAAGPHCNGAYFASVRFLIAARLAAEGRALMVTDIDIRFRRSPDDVAALARPFAFASFVNDGIGPCSRLPAVLTWFDGGAASCAMLTALRRTVLSKLHVGWPHNWMLDQAALMTARRWLRRHHPEAAIGEFNRLNGLYFPEYLDCLGDEEDKAALIREAAGT